jgi:hypothetical protein
VSAPNVTEGLDLLLAARDNAATQADRLDQDAEVLEVRAAAMRTKAAGLRELASVAARYVGPGIGEAIAPRGAVQ